MEFFENILTGLIICLAASYLVVKFYNKWKLLTDPSSSPSCDDGCCSCKKSSCSDREFPSAGV